MGTAWGEIRYTWGSTFTKYTYTGQYSNVPEFGLYYYNARWVDPQLGRFVQADIVVQGDNRKSNTTVTGVAETQYVPLTVQYSGEPAILNKLNADNAFLLSKGGLHNLSREDRQKAKIAGVPLESQVLDRYAYSLNNPIKYNDPTGYDICGGVSSFGYCYNDSKTIVTLWMDGYKVAFNLMVFDANNNSDKTILDDIASFIKAADEYKIKQQYAGWNFLAASGSLAPFALALLSCVAPQQPGCFLGLPGSFALLAATVGLTRTSIEDAASSWNIGANKMSILLQQTKGQLFREIPGRKVYPWDKDYRK